MQTGNFLSDIGLSYQLNLKSRWSVTLHEVVSSMAPLTLLSPRRCVLRQLTDSATCVWPVVRRGRGKDREARRPQSPSAAEPAGDGAAAAAADLDGNINEAEEAEVMSGSEDDEEMFLAMDESEDSDNDDAAMDLDELMETHLEELQQSHTIQHIQQHLGEEDGEPEAGREAQPVEEFFPDHEALLQGVGEAGAIQGH